MTKLRIAVYAADNGGCGKYRLDWPAKAVNDAFDDVEVLYGDTRPNIVLKWREAMARTDRTEWATLSDAYTESPVDVVVFQRPLSRVMVMAIELLRKRGIGIVIDLDDNFDLIDPQNVAWFGAAPYWHNPDQVQAYIKRYGRVNIAKQSADEQWFYLPDHRGSHHRGNVHEALKHAHIFTASTPSIRNHYRARESMLVRNHIPARFLDITEERDGQTLGWTGTVATHPGDFRPIGAGLKLAKASTNFKFKIVGYPEGFYERTSVEPDESTGWVDISQYPHEYAKLDAVICPLDDQQFNSSKSWLKPLEAAALGVVPIMTPTPEYEEINKLGIGVLAGKPKQWDRQITKVMGDPSYRAELAVAGKEVAKTLTIEGNAHLWYNAWKRAAELAKE